MLMTLAGMVGAGLTYMGMREQRHLHDRLAGIKFTLAKQTDWQTETFSPHDTGYHTLHLSTVNTSRNSAASDTAGASRTFYHGIFEARIAAPSGEIIWTRQMAGSTFFLVLPPHTAWMFIDSVYIQNAGEGVWKLQTRVVQADERFAPTYSELIVMPPQALDIAIYIYGESLKLMGLGLLIPIGFCVLLLGGYLQKRIGRSEPMRQSDAG